jgi:outer membrane biosynthesis protein TonB
MARANCVYPGQEAATAAVQQNASTEPVVVELNTCGGDDTSYQVPLSVDVTFDGRTFNSVYATTNSVITFGAPDGTYWDYPQTPSISLYSFDWVVYPQWRNDEHLIIRSSDGGFQVDISARPIWLQNATEPTHIVITAAILSDGTVAMAYTLTGPEYPQNNPRTGVRLNNGQVVDFETYGIQETEETPELAPEPTEEAPFNPPAPEPPAPSLNSPTNVTATQLQDGTVQLTWDAPTPTSTSVERYAVSWSTDNFTNNGWGVASTTNSINISRDAFATTGGLDQTYQFRIRSDNDTAAIYSSFSNIISTVVASPPPPVPTVPDGATVTNEGSFVEIVAPEGQRIASAVGYYGDPNDSTRGEEVSSILFELLSGETSATIEVSNETFLSDPAPGTPKVLILLIVYEDIPVQTQPSPGENAGSEQQPSTPVSPEPEPSQEPSPEPTIPPQPEETEPPVEPTPLPVEPSPEPEPIEPPIIEPEEESITSAEELPEELSSEELMQVDLEEIVATDLSEAQVEALIEAALETFETAEQGSEEYVQALEALFVAAQADDIVLDEALVAIPLLGDVLGGATELINFLGNAGADMSPQVREDSEKVVVTAIVAVQAALSAISISGIATTINIRSGA